MPWHLHCSKRSSGRESDMSDTAIVGENVEVVQTVGGRTGRSAFVWSVVIAGALAAWAVAFVIVALGAGIGLSITSPYWGASATALGIGGALWLIFAHTCGFATGGYLAGRLRIRDHIPGPETKFRDAAHGFMAWVIGASLMGIALFAMGAFTAKTTADVLAPIAGSAAGSAAASAANDNSGNDATGYFVDLLFRGSPGAPGTQTTAAPGAGTVGSAPASVPTGVGTQRAEASRIILASIRRGSLSDPDKQYLAQLVSARTGLTQDEAVRRVDQVEQQATATVKEAADKTRKAAAYLSFWSFMALLFGAAGATLGGILGGELRDEI
jgi:hypothetical protein